MKVRNTNDGSAREPRLRIDIHYSNVKGLPEYSSGPQGDDLALHRAIKAAGFEGVQGGIPELCRELGLGMTGSARVNRAEEAAVIARDKKEEGFECVTLHVGWGTEDDLESHRLVEAVLEASQKYNIPLYIETHRATITQDLWRTVQLTCHFPEIRFNGDFSHWYNGLEMVYGGFETKRDFIRPVLDRVRFLHARIASPGSIQVGIGDGRHAEAVAHFQELWTRSMAGFLRTAEPGDYMCFTPELLGPDIHYARLVPSFDGEWREESDRWLEAQRYLRMGRECWARAARMAKE